MKQALLLSSNVQGGGKRRVFTSSGIRCLRAPAPGEAIRGCFCRPGLAHDVSVPPKGSCTNLAPVSPKLAGDFLFLARHVHIGYRCRQSALSRLRPPWTWAASAALFHIRDFHVSVSSPLKSPSSSSWS